MLTSAHVHKYKYTDSLHWHIKRILWPPPKKSMEAVTQMEKSWQVKKSKRAKKDRSWSRHRGDDGKNMEWKGGTSISSWFSPLSLWSLLLFFVVSAKILNHLDWIITAGCVRHFNEGDGLQLVYGDLIGCWSLLQSPPPLPWASNWLFI